MSRFGEGHGKPSELHPRSVAKALELVTDGPTTWASLLDAACNRYWSRRVENPGDKPVQPVDNTLPTPRKPGETRVFTLTPSTGTPSCTLPETGGEAA